MKSSAPHISALLSMRAHLLQRSQENLLALDTTVIQSQAHGFQVWKVQTLPSLVKSGKLWHSTQLGLQGWRNLRGTPERIEYTMIVMRGKVSASPSIRKEKKNCA